MIKDNKFDIVITTNNRADSILKLINDILEHKFQSETIIVVDSSNSDNKELQSFEKVKYIRSSHKNQPYQRYVGYLASQSPILIYLDDDMEINNSETMKIITEHFNNKEVIGVAINFINHNEFLEKTVPKSKFRIDNKKSLKNTIIKMLKNFSGQQSLEDGDYSFNGLKGKQPANGGPTKWFSGGSFAVKKEFLYKNFNFNLFDLYETGLGKGEDGIIGYTLSKQGNLVFEPNILFIHNDQKDSVYTKNMFSFSQRVLFSRFYLSLEFSRLNNIGKIKPYIYFHWYALWRVFGLLINQLFSYNKERKMVLDGYLSAWKKVSLNKVKFQKKEFWENEALNDIN